MMKRAYIYFNYTNKEVLQDYLNIVKESLENNDYAVEYTNSLSYCEKKGLIVFPVAYDAFKFYLKGFRNFVLWQQGAVADESYMRNSSRVRYHILNLIDIFMMKKAKLVLYVSDEMRIVYEKRGKCSFKNKSYIMPCFNERFDEEIYKIKDYTKPVFTYVGSLAEWQCFDQTAELYSKIEKRIPNSKLKVLTFNVDEAEEIIKRKGITNYEVKCVPKEEVNRELQEAVFGFIIREDNTVNRVATPTKLSSYIAAGVIPIFSSCIKDFEVLSNKYDYVKTIPNSLGDSAKIIVDFAKLPINKENVRKEFKDIFDTYYNRALHIADLSVMFSRIL